MTVRPATVEDVPWLVETAAAAYEVDLPDFNRAGAEQWIRACLADPNTVVLRGIHAAAFGQIVRPPWDPGNPCMDMIHLYGGRRNGPAWECVQAVAALDAVRKERGCSKLYVGSIYADLEPVAKWLGGRKLGSLYALEG